MTCRSIFGAVRFIRGQARARRPPEITAHALRGLLATLSGERGIAGHVIAATLGHEDVRTTEHAYMAPGSSDAGARRRGLVVLNGGALPSHAREIPADIAAVTPAPVHTQGAVS